MHEWRYVKITWLHKRRWHKQFVRNTSRSLALTSAYRWAVANVPSEAHEHASVRALKRGEIPDEL